MFVYINPHEVLRILETQFRNVENIDEDPRLNDCEQKLKKYIDGKSFYADLSIPQFCQQQLLHHEPYVYSI
jgi:hypothetical protein